jgi:hypothetical protein
MRNKITISEPDLISNQKIKASDHRSTSTPDLTEKKSNLEILSAEGDEDFVNYVEWLGFLNDPNLVVLSSSHHYYYDAEEMKSVRTVVNLIELNQIRNVPGFFNSIFHLLPSKSYFIGCFIDNQNKSRYSLRNNISLNSSKRDSEAAENGISSSIPFFNMLYNLLDSKTNKHCSRKGVTQLLGDHGFKVLDMTELNGHTYFCAQKLLTVVK